jgi:hypothetical protein
MLASSNLRSWCAGLLILAPIGVARADDDAAKTRLASQPAAEEPGISLFDAARSGAVTVGAEGTGDGMMNVNITNNTNRKLKVVLPPGLVASGVSGQMGGMGGMGGGMGGMGGGGMGGMGGGGMGGMGGGGMGGGGMGGGMGGMGGGSRPLTMMPLQGLSSVANMIMNLVQPATWDRMAFMRGMMAAMGSGGMMGGMGMGGMGGGMGGMGGGMGGMGGGFRSVPPTDLPSATLAPGQSRDLKTRLVRLGGPNAEGGVDFPAQGEPLTLGDVGQTDASPKVQTALRRLARDGAPETVSQLVLWAAAGMPWTTIAQLSKGWANPQELALAKQLVADLDAKGEDADTGRILIEVTSKTDATKAIADQLNTLFQGKTMLGLAIEGTVPAKPTGPAVACKVQIGGTVEKPEALVQLASSDANASSWLAVGKFELPVPRDEAGKVKAEVFGDALAEGLLDRLVRVIVRKQSNGMLPAAPKTVGAYLIRIENYSPLLLNGLAVSGMKPKAGDPIKLLLGISLAPRRTFVVPVTAESVEKLGLKDIKPVALDLSGL